MSLFVENYSQKENFVEIDSIDWFFFKRTKSKKKKQ